jgi:hypothetical protein
VAASERAARASAAATTATTTPVTRAACALRSVSRTLARWLPRLLKGGLGGGVAMQAATAATLPEERSELTYHLYDGGGVKASGPALLVRKNIADRWAVSGSYYVDAVSNASIDVVTSASPFKETRTAADLGVDWLVRDTLLSATLYRSTEPDYEVDTIGADVTHEVFGGMTTVNLGFSRSRDVVMRKNEPNFRDRASHWQYRFGVTQVLSPRWLASLNAEAINDEGYLGSPYRVAYVFGAPVRERVPRTRSSRAIKLRTIYDFGDGASRTALRAEYRHYWDNWEIKAGTAEIGISRYLPREWGAPGTWLVDAAARFYSQDKALFYSDNATSETLFVSRFRQLSTFKSNSLVLKATWTPTHETLTRYDARFSFSFERKQFRYSDFTDLRTGAPYGYDANVLALTASARF